MCFFRPWRDRVPVGGCVLAELHAQGGREVGRGCPRKPARQIGAPPPFPSLARGQEGPHPAGLPRGASHPLPLIEAGEQHSQEGGHVPLLSLGHQACGLTRALEFLAPDLPLDVAGVMYGDQSLWHEVFSGDFYGCNYGEML